MTARRFTADEDALVALHRAFTAYVRERTCFDNTLDDAKPDDEVYVELHPDGSGALIIDPENPNLPNTRAASWLVVYGAELAIERATARLVEERVDRENHGRRRFGDPRRGRPRPSRLAPSSGHR